MGKGFGVGIIGAGVMFGHHAAALKALENRARLIGVADLDESKLRSASARHFVPYTYTDHRKLLARDDIDIVTITTPPSAHEQLVVEALDAGKHVICEKPLAHTLEAADRIIDIASRSQGRLTVGYQHRFWPEIKKLVWLRDNGWLGDLQSGSFMRMTPFTKSAATDWWGRWEIAGGGLVMTQFIHELDLMIHIFGEPVEVYAVVDTLQQDIESEDTLGATVRFESGAVVTCCSTLNAHGGETLLRYDIVGSRASAHFPWAIYASDLKHRREMLRALETAMPGPKPVRQSLPVRAMHNLERKVDGTHSLPARAMRKALRRLGARSQLGSQVYRTSYIAAFLDALENGGEVPVSHEEARRSLELCTAIYASALSGTVVSLPLDESSVCYRGITTDVYRERRSAGVRA